MSKNYLWGAIFLAMTFCLLVPFAVMGWLNYKASRDIARAEITQSALPLTRDNIYSEIHGDLLEPIYVSTTMANDSFLKEWAGGGEKSLSSITDYLSEIQRKYNYFSVFFVSARTNKYYHYRGLHKVISEKNKHDQWYYDFLKTGKEYRLEVDSDEATGNQLTVFINFRVENARHDLLGVTGVGMKMDMVSKLLRETGLKYGRRVFLVDRWGEVQAHADPSYIHTKNINKMSGISLVAKDILLSLDKVTNLQYETNKGMFFVTSRYMPELDWFLIVEQDESQALAVAKRNFIRTLIFCAIIWFFLIMLFGFAARRYQGRMRQLARIDELTRLGNRRSFEEEFHHARYYKLRTGEAVSLILIDLDGFKAVNDILGHLAGDKLLVDVSGILHSSLRDQDKAFRWGGDEFAILSFCSEEEAMEQARKLCRLVKEKMLLLSKGNSADPRYKVSISCGVAEYDGGDSAEVMLHAADRGLYSCKDSGGDCVSN